MKYKVARSLLVLSLALILVIGGTTVAWFTAEFEIPSVAKINMSTMSLEITNAVVYSLDDGLPEETAETIEWEAGDCKEFSWTLKNTGQASFLRAQVKGILTPEATPAGNGAAVEGNNCCAGLFTGETEAAGDGWIDWALPGEGIEKNTGTKGSGEAGGAGTVAPMASPSPAGAGWIKGDDGWFYYCPPLESEEKITLVLTGILSDDALDSQCSVQLKAEAVQTAPGAIDAEWPESPCAR